ncbi:MAG: type III-B CRISPR module RAMP protein Cmr1 [Blastocatellia bacterium]
MELQLKTLTPLWTGGVETGKVDRLHETGILGSLRWWMEVFARGMGGNACDPTNHPCQYAEKTNDGLCDVCRVFGATGWRRRFRLDIRDSTSPDNTVSPKIEIKRPYKDKHGKVQTPRGWYFPDNLQAKPRSGRLAIHIQSLAQDFQPEVIAGLIQFVADWTSLGARAQMGFGVIEPVNGRIETRALYDWLIATAGSHPNPNLASLQNIFLAQIKPKDSNQSFTEQTTFNLKYDLRRLYASDQKLRHFIMGTVSGERIAAKVKMSRPYGDGVMRVWGWIPEKTSVYKDNWNRDAVAKVIHDHLKANYALQVWREMNSTLDTVAQSISDAQVFMHSLLGLKEGDDAA